MFPEGRTTPVLYSLVREHLATFLAHTERTYAAPLPKYVVDTFDDYLGCGDVAGGFLRCHCEGCGHDVLVAFSCKHRGLCPSCGARRMCNEAVQVVDRVLPNVPVRQWVLSLPWELRRLAAMKPGVVGAMDRIFAEEIARTTRRLAGIEGAQTGSVGCPQIFGGGLTEPRVMLPLDEEERRVYTLLYQQVEQFRKQRGTMAMRDIDAALKSWDEVVREALQKLTPAERLEGVAPRERLEGLDRDHQALALPDEVLPMLTEAYLGSLSPEVQEELRRRLLRAAH